MSINSCGCWNKRRITNNTHTHRESGSVFVSYCFDCVFFNWCYALLNGFVFNYDMRCHAIGITLLHNPFWFVRVYTILRWCFSTFSLVIFLLANSTYNFHLFKFICLAICIGDPFLLSLVPLPLPMFMSILLSAN